MYALKEFYTRYEIKEYAQCLIDQLAEKYGVTMAPTKWTNMERLSVCRRIRKQANGKGVFRLVFGLRMMENDMRDGYVDYKTVHPRIKKLGARRPKGLEAIYWLVVHEFSHAVQVDAGMRLRGQMHNAFFMDTMNKIAAEFSFEYSCDVAQFYGKLLVDELDERFPAVELQDEGWDTALDAKIPPMTKPPWMSEQVWSMHQAGAFPTLNLEQATGVVLFNEAVAELAFEMMAS